MLNFDDERWSQLEAGYRIVFDVRPLLLKLNSGRDTPEVWKELWNELHHQGDVGAASYAAVPHLVKIHKERGIVDWNTYAIVAVIELARTESNNPDVPNWLNDSYFQAVNDLARIGTAEIFKTSDTETVRSILSLLAIAKDLRIHGQFVLDYSEDELLEMKKRSGDFD